MIIRSRVKTHTLRNRRAFNPVKIYVKKVDNTANRVIVNNRLSNAKV